MVVIHPGQRCTTLSGEDLRFEMSIAVRTWGNSPSGTTRSVVCAYEGRSEVSARLLDALPPVLVLHADEWDTHWWTCWRPRPAATARARRHTWTGYSTCC